MDYLQCLIIDDEAPSRRLLRQKLQDPALAVQVLAEAASAEEALQLIHIHQPPLIFLDIEMPRMNGFALLEQIPQRNFEVIFVTAYDHYAVQAIRMHALDYLVKPVDPVLLEEAVSNARKNLENKRHNERLNLLLKQVQPGSPVTSKMAISSAEGIEFIDLDEIIYLEAESNYTCIYTTDDRKITASRNLHHFEALLPPDRFFRIHHSVIIHLGKIKKYVRGDGGQVCMLNGQWLDVSRRKKDDFLSAMGLG